LSYYFKKINQSTILTREDVGIMKNMSFDAKILKTKKKEKNSQKLANPVL
jgi:hypothetical protein